MNVKIQNSSEPGNSAGSPLPSLPTRGQVADYVGVCPHTVARYTRAGLLPCVRINSRVIRYRREDVQAFVNAAVGN